MSENDNVFADSEMLEWILERTEFGFTRDTGNRVVFFRIEVPMDARPVVCALPPSDAAKRGQLRAIMDAERDKKGGRR